MSAEEVTQATAADKPNGSEAKDAAGAPGIGQQVAAHYNQLEEAGIHTRKDSRIFHMRNLNNWIKSQLINEYVNKIKEKKGRGERIAVLDLGCGKGGDLKKWEKAGVHHVVFADIAATSVEQCRERYQRMRRPPFTAEFVAADCTRERLRDRYRDPGVRFDLVSCQFAFHYCFESLPQAECMLRNATECLARGGYFVGTTPDANDVVYRLKAQGEVVAGGDGRQRKAGNSLYSVTSENFDPTPGSADKIPLFGARYMFHLEGVVDCPEFLVHFPTLEKLAEAERYGSMVMVAKRRFANYYKQFEKQGMTLLGRMNALEAYPPPAGRSSEGRDESYAHAKAFLEANGGGTVGTLSREEWEAATLYLIFAFKKMGD